MYFAHPIGDRILIDPNRFIPAIEQGNHTFSFRLSYDPREQLENNAQAFVNTPYSLNFFPHGNGEVPKGLLSVEEPATSLAAFYWQEDGYQLRLVNNSETKVSASIVLCGKTENIEFSPHEVKILVYSDGKLQEKEYWV